MAEIILNKTKVPVGLIGAYYTGHDGRRVKLSVEKQNTNHKYIYDLYNSLAWFPLPYGNGTYIISARVQLADQTKYYVPLTESLTVNMTDPNVVFLQSNVYMNWRDDMMCVRCAKYLTAGARRTQPS